jgi:hypothetical protein
MYFLRSLFSICFIVTHFCHFRLRLREWVSNMMFLIDFLAMTETVIVYMIWKRFNASVHYIYRYITSWLGYSVWLSLVFGYWPWDGSECALVVNLAARLSVFSAVMLLLVVVAKTCCLQFSLGCLWQRYRLVLLSQLVIALCFLLASWKCLKWFSGMLLWRHSYLRLIEVMYLQQLCFLFIVGVHSSEVSAMHSSSLFFGLWLKGKDALTSIILVCQYTTLLCCS